MQQRPAHLQVEGLLIGTFEGNRALLVSTTWYSRLQFNGSFLKKRTQDFVFVCGAGHHWHAPRSAVLENPVVAPPPEPPPRQHPTGAQPQSLCVVDRFTDKHSSPRCQWYVSKSRSQIRTSPPLFRGTAVRVQIFPQSRKEEIEGSLMGDLMHEYGCPFLAQYWPLDVLKIILRV